MCVNRHPDLVKKTRVASGKTPAGTGRSFSSNSSTSTTTKPAGKLGSYGSVSSSSSGSLGNNGGGTANGPNKRTGSNATASLVDKGPRSSDPNTPEYYDNDKVEVGPYGYVRQMGGLKGY